MVCDLHLPAARSVRSTIVLLLTGRQRLVSGARMGSPVVPERGGGEGGEVVC